MQVRDDSSVGHLVFNPKNNILGKFHETLLGKASNQRIVFAVKNHD